MSTEYEVMPGPAAIRTILGLSDPERKELTYSLLTELLDGPNADKEVRFDGDMRACDHHTCGPDDVVYTATPLNFGAYVALHRRMTREELKRLRRDQGRKVAGSGFYVLDILPPGTAFTRGPRLVGHI
jgi:hypothetical protein